MTEVADNTLVDGRYRVLNRIGSGGMADVYCAEDTHLGRQVALKVLYRRFAQDAEFVERFRREASSAASLQHPSIVSVYDRGDHDGTYYIAMELLGGRTLKEVVKADAPLSQERAIDIAVQILQAAGFAHRRGVIHRDFKPHNVLVADDDSVKVTDFGIARMGASEMTETGSVMGTAQYLSPEQAQGHTVSASSDIYSIGVIVFELLGGQPPFEGDTAVAVALKHLNEEPPPLSELRPDVHPALVAVVARALAKDPADRYPNAEEFVAALDDARHQIEGGAPSPSDTAVFSPGEVAAAAGGAVAGAAAGAALSEAAANQIDSGTADYAGGTGEGPPADGEEEKSKRWPWFALGLVLLGLVGVVLWATVLQPEQVKVPKVVGMQEAVAEATLDRVGLKAKITQASDDTAPVGQVFEQNPRPGERADEDSTVELIVSTGPEKGPVPSVEGLSQARAIKELNERGFKKVTTDLEPSDTVKKGFAIRTVPAGGQQDVPKSERIRLFVSSGVQQIDVPNVVGATQSSADARLESDELIAVVEERASDQPEDQVIAQDPVAGTRVDKGSRVTITVSKGPDRASVPDVGGLSEGNARGELRDAGFGVQVREQATTEENQDGVVIDQDPGGGTQVRKGKTVVITIGQFEPEPIPPTPDTGE